MRKRILSIVSAAALCPPIVAGLTAPTSAVAAANPFEVQAEALVVSGTGAAVSSAGTGFSGSGYVVWDGSATLATSALSFPQGSYRVEVRYRAVTATLPRTVGQVGGAAVPLSFPPNAASWTSSSWGVATGDIVLGAGPQTVRLTSPGGGRVDIDRVTFVPTFDPVTVQAETWTVAGVGPTVRTSPAGFTGTGFIGSWSAANTSVNTTISFPPGVYAVTARYRQASTSAVRSIQINGLPVSKLAFAQNTANWSDAVFASTSTNVSLPAGPFRFGLVNVDGSTVDLDSVTFRYVGPLPPNTVTFDAEAWSLVGAGVRVSTTNGGFTGAGYIGDWTGSGSGVATKMSTARGLHLFTYRYRLAGTASSPRVLSVAGEPAGTVVFKPTATSWTSTTWRTAAQLVSMPGGSVPVRLLSTGTAPVDLDRIMVTPVATTGTTVFPAETMTLTGTQIGFARANGGFQDYGYVTGGAAGEKAARTMYLPSGSYTVSVRYRNAGAATSRQIVFNGAAAGQLTLLKNAAAWADTTWTTATAAVTVPNGPQRFELVVPSGATPVDVDTVTFKGSSGSTTTSTTVPSNSVTFRFPAELMARSGTQLMKTSTDNPVWEDVGYVGMWGMAGETLTQQLSAPAGTYTLSLRYRNADAPATRAIKVNGVTVTTAAFPANTSAWANNVWSTSKVTVTLPSGAQSVAVVNPDGNWSNWIDLDTVTFTSGAQPPSTTTTTPAPPTTQPPTPTTQPPSTTTPPTQPPTSGVQPGRFSGRITRDGAPLSGVTVKVVNIYTPGWPRLEVLDTLGGHDGVDVFVTTTDGNGNWSVSGLPTNKQYMLKIFPPSRCDAFAEMSSAYVTAESGYVNTWGEPFMSTRAAPGRDTYNVYSAGRFLFDMPVHVYPNVSGALSGARGYNDLDVQFFTRRDAFATSWGTVSGCAG